MMEEKEKSRKEKKPQNLFWVKFRYLFFGFIIGVILSLGFWSKIKNEFLSIIKTESRTLNIDYLTGRIRNMSDLITSELEYTGIVEYKANEGKWNSFFIAEEFLMVYNAEIRAGIDMTKVELKEKDNVIEVTIPHATVKFKKVKPETIRFYDLKKAWIKGDGKEQTKDAILDAENDVDKNANIKQLLESAENQAKSVIEGLIREIDKEKQVKFVFSK